MFKKDDKVKVVKGIKAFEGLTGTVLDTNGNQVKVKLNLSNDSELQKNLINVFEAYQLELESLDLLKEDNVSFDNDVEPEKKICCICGEEYEGYGNNAEPYKEGYCCDECNKKFVIPSRLKEGYWKSNDDYKEFIDLCQKLSLNFRGEIEDYLKKNNVPNNAEARLEFLRKQVNNKNESLKLDEGFIISFNGAVDCAKEDIKDGKTKEEFIQHMRDEFKLPKKTYNDTFFNKVWDEANKTNESLKLTEEELKAWCSDNDANYYTQDIKDDKVIIRGLNEDLAEYNFKTKELKVFDYSGTTVDENALEENEEDNNYIRDYVYDIDMIDEKTEIPSWEFASIIATAEDTTEDAVVTEAHDRGFKVYLITASEYEKLVIASEKITEKDIMDDFASYLEGNPKVTEVI